MYAQLAWQEAEMGNHGEADRARAILLTLAGWTAVSDQTSNFHKDVFQAALAKTAMPANDNISFFWGNCMNFRVQYISLFIECHRGDFLPAGDGLAYRNSFDMLRALCVRAAEVPNSNVQRAN